MADVIDPRKLLKSTMFDSSALVAASGGRARDGEGDASKQLYDAIMAAGSRELLVAAPSFAEFLRKSPKRDAPRLHGFEVVPFDRAAAKLLASKFPKEALTQFRDQSAKKGAPIDYIKYDAMIVACALRHRADVFVSFDNDQRKMASAVGLRVMYPSDFLSRQTAIDFQHPPEETPAQPSKPR